MERNHTEFDPQEHMDEDEYPPTVDQPPLDSLETTSTVSEIILDEEASRPLVDYKTTRQQSGAADQTVKDDSEYTEPTTTLNKSDQKNGETVAAPVRLLGGTKVGVTLDDRYKLKNVLGEGGFGEVYLADDLRLGRLCVVKRMLVRKNKPLEELRENFRREADLLVELNHPGHPNIPEIYDKFFADDGNYLVMKYVEGRNLKQVLAERRTPLPYKEVLRYAVRLCDALHYMHTGYERPVVHRDIKPTNILIDINDQTWLVDFGLADKTQPVEEPTDDSDSLRRASGTLGYTPLEQWFGDPTPTSDIYALGATIHHLLTNLNPAQGMDRRNFLQTLQVTHGQFIPIRSVNKDVPPELDEIIAKATGTDPERRPSALQFKQQLDVFLSGGKNTPIFTFRNGEKASIKEELVDLCELYQDEARGYLYGGDFERWFRLTNRNDLANAAVRALKQPETLPEERRRERLFYWLLPRLLLRRQDGLERFLRLIFPNLFARRLRRAALILSREVAQLGALALALLAILIVISSYLGGWFIERRVANHDWNEVELVSGRAYQEMDLEELIIDNTGAAFDAVEIDLHNQEALNFKAQSDVIAFDLPLNIHLEEQTPQFELTGYSFPLRFLIGNLIRGINNGLITAFSRHNFEMTMIETSEDWLQFDLLGLEPRPAPATDDTAAVEENATNSRSADPTNSDPIAPGVYSTTIQIGDEPPVEGDAHLELRDGKVLIELSQ